jgi:hypothetical protein
MKTVVKKLYFAYGSNMDQERLESRVGKVTKIGTQILPCWKLEFDCGPRDRRFANITMTADARHGVEGVLYELTSKQMRLLDDHEGCPDFYQKLAFPMRDGKTMYAYVCLNPLYRPLPKAIAQEDYMAHIIKGCKENNLGATLRVLMYLKGKGVVAYKS